LSDVTAVFFSSILVLTPNGKFWGFATIAFMSDVRDRT
jgi:hypothetical protein